MPASARNSIRGLICSHASPPQSHRLCLGEVAKRHACFRKAHHSSTMASLAVKHMLPKRKLLGNIRVSKLPVLNNASKATHWSSGNACFQHARVSSALVFTQCAFRDALERLFAKGRTHHTSGVKTTFILRVSGPFGNFYHMPTHNDE